MLPFFFWEEQMYYFDLSLKADKGTKTPKKIKRIFYGYEVLMMDVDIDCI